MMSCCTCGNNCQNGCGCRIIILPDNPVEQWNFQNDNLTGVGVLDGVDGMDVNFRGLVSLSVALTVALNAGNNTIEIDFDDSQLVAAIPDATTVQRGILETATDAEALAKALNNKIVTPSNFAAMASTITFAGLVELSTNAEALAGVDAVRALTPANLAFVIANSTLGTRIFADAVARAGATPQFEGQYGYQADTNIPYVAYGVALGNWEAMLALGNANNVMVGTTTLTIGTADTFSVSLTNANAEFLFTGIGSLSISSTLNFPGGSLLAMGGVTVTDCLLGADGSGTVNTFLISQFATLFDTSTGWTGFTNSAVRKVGDCNTITLPQLAQVVDTLINILKVPQLPAT